MNCWKIFPEDGPRQKIFKDFSKTSGKRKSNPKAEKKAPPKMKPKIKMKTGDLWKSNVGEKNKTGSGFQNSNTPPWGCFYIGGIFWDPKKQAPVFAGANFYFRRFFADLGITSPPRRHWRLSVPDVPRAPALPALPLCSRPARTRCRARSAPRTA